MSFRITTNGMFHNYRRNLSQSTKNLYESMTRVQTERYFNSYAEDPAEANRAFQLRRFYWNTGNQIDNSNYVRSKFETGWGALKTIVGGDVDHPGLDGIYEALRGVTGTAGSSRTTLGQTLISTAESIVSMMNVRYGDEFVFAGADGLNVPFTWGVDEEGNRVLMYRGVNVNAKDPDTVAKELELDPRPLTESEFNALGGKYDSLKVPEGSTEFNEYLDGVKEADPEADPFTVYKDWYAKAYDVEETKLDDYYDGIKDYEKLQAMNEETTLVDIGLGFRLEADGTINPATAYNSALSGIGILGFGQDEDGDSLNLVSLMQELGEIFSRCDPDSGAYVSTDDQDRAEFLVGKLRSAIGRVQEQHIVLDGKNDYLNKNLDQLQDNKLNLNEEIERVERMDMAAAIEDMMWAQYTYNAALRIGTQILSQSLFDYLS